MPSTARSTLPEPDLGGAHVRHGRRRAARSGPDVAAARQGLCRAWLHAPGTNTDAATFGALTTTGSPGHGSAFEQACSWTPRLWRLGWAPARRPGRPADARTEVVGQGCASALWGGRPHPAPPTRAPALVLEAASAPPGAARPWAVGRDQRHRPRSTARTGRSARRAVPQAGRRAAAHRGVGGQVEVP